MSNIVTIEFHGDRLLGIETEAGAFAYLKPIVERLGLDWSAQLKRVKRDPTLREGMAMMATPPGYGDGNEAVFLRLDLLHGWLFTVDSARVREELRPKVIVYQRECYAALAAAFAPQDRGARPAELLDAPTNAIPLDIARKLVTEARHTFDHQAARELWFQLRLPIAPHMRAFPEQGALFTYQRKN